MKASPAHPARISRDRHYASIADAATSLGVSTDALLGRMQRKAGKRIRNITTGAGLLVCLEDLGSNHNFTSYSPEVRVDEGGFFNDEEGCWCTVDAFWVHLDEEIKSRTTKQSILLQAQRRCRSRKAIDRCDRPDANIYLFNDLLATGLRLLDIGKVINPYTRFCQDEDGMKWGSKRFWIDEMKVSNRALDNGVKAFYGSWENTPQELGRNAIIKNGQITLQKTVPLFSEAVIRKILEYIFDAPIIVRDGIYTIADEVSNAVEAVYYSAAKLSEEIPVETDYITRKLKAESCPQLEGVDRKSGANVTIFEINRAREVFWRQIKIVVETDENGEFLDDIYGRCMTVERFCSTHPDVNRKWLMLLIDEHKAKKITRRDPRFNYIVTLYPETELERIISV